MGVRSVLDDIGWFDVAISHGKIKLKMLIAAIHGSFSDDPDSRNAYRQLGNVVGESDLELELPALNR